MTSRPRQILDFFKSSLEHFQNSNSNFTVVCTLQRSAVRSSPNTSQDAASHELPIPTPAEPTAPPRRLIVLDSSFNPPTRAHMRMATSAIQSLDENTRKDARLLLLLAVKNADKAPKPASFEHRLAMMWACAADLQQSHESQQHGNIPIDLGLTTHPFFHDKSAAIADLPVYNNGQERAVRTMRDEPEMEQVFLAGYDTLIRIFNPKYFDPPSSDAAAAQDITPMQAALDPFFAQSRLRITMRPDDEWGDRAEQMQYLEALENLEEKGGRGSWARRVEMVEGRTAQEKIVSSTAAREKTKEGNWEAMDALVGPLVGGWIRSQGLFVDD